MNRNFVSNSNISSNNTAMLYLYPGIIMYICFHHHYKNIKLQAICFYWLVATKQKYKILKIIWKKKKIKTQLCNQCAGKSLDSTRWHFFCYNKFSTYLLFCFIVDIANVDCSCCCCWLYKWIEISEAEPQRKI